MLGTRYCISRFQREAGPLLARGRLRRTSHGLTAFGAPLQGALSKLIILILGWRASRLPQATLGHTFSVKTDLFTRDPWAMPTAIAFHAFSVKRGRCSHADDCGEHRTG